MIHPTNYLYGLSSRLNLIKNLLLNENDNKADILAMLPEMLEAIEKATTAFFKHEEQKNEEHQKYFDEVIFEFSTDNKFEDGIHRHLKGYLLDMKDIKNWVDAERRMQNKNDEYMHARITLIDFDAEDFPDTEKLED